MSIAELLKQPTPAVLSEWVQQFRQQSLVEALGDISDFTNALVQLSDKVQVFNMIETVRPFFHALNPLLQSDPTVAEGRAYIQLLELEITVYEHILEKPSELPEPVLATAIHRSLTNKIQDQVTHYRYYLLIPERKWLRIHRLFYVALKHKVATSIIEDEIYFHQKKSIVNLYCYLLLLSCAHLSHFTSEEIVKTAKLLEQWCELVKISKTPASDSQNQIMVDIATGSAPHFTKMFSPAESTMPCYLQMDELMQVLVGMWMERSEQNQQPDDAWSQHDLTADMLEYLKAAWSGYLYEEALTKTHQEVEVCVGFEDVHFYLAGAKNLDDFLGEKVSLSVVYDDAEDKEFIEHGRMEDLWATFLAEPKGDPDFKKTPAEFNFQHHFKSLDEDIHTAQHPRYRVLMTEMGLHDCSLMWDAQQAPDLEPGQIIGLRSQMTDHWQVGEIDSKIQLNDKKIKTGVKIISTQAIPVGIDLPFGVEENYCEAILTPPEQAISTMTSFLSPPRDYKAGEYVSISQKNIEEKVQIVKTMKKNLYFERCACTFLIKKRIGGAYRDEVADT